MTRTRILTVVVVLALIGVGVTFLGAANRSSSAESAPAGGEKPAAVVAFGTLETKQGSIQLFPENFPQPCKITKVLVEEGDTVKKDQVLLEADPEAADNAIELAKLKLKEAQVGVEVAQAKLHQAEQMLEGHEVMIASQELKLESKKSDLDAADKKLQGAKEQWEKVNAATRQNRGKPSELLAAEDSYLAASKAWMAEKINLDGMKKIKPVSKREEAQAGVKAAEQVAAEAALGVKQAELARKVLTLKAPADGKILGRYVEEGQTFGPQTRQPAFLFNFNGPLLVRAEVDQEWADKVKKGMKVVIEEDFKSGQSWNGKVTNVGDAFVQKRNSSAMLDPFQPSNEPRVLPCTISLDTPQDVSKLRIGQKVKVRIGVE